jgi:hypothetical protein
MNTQTLFKLMMLVVVLSLSACGGAQTTEAPVAQEAPSGVAQEIGIKFKTVDNQRLASVELDLTGVGPAGDGKMYAVWLVDDQQQPTFIGPASSGQTFVYTDPAGENLIGKISATWVSVETESDIQAATQGEPTAETWRASRIPPAIISQVRLMVVKADDTPAQMPYDPGLKQQSIIAAEHGQLTLDAIKDSNLKVGQQHIEHVLNTLNGEVSPKFGDINGDGKVENPGDGYGVWPYAAKVADIADQVAATADLPALVHEAAVTMGACARKFPATWGPQASEHAQAILDAADAAAAEPAALALVEILNQMSEGVDANNNGAVELVEAECGANQIYQISHGLFEIPLTLR